MKIEDVDRFRKGLDDSNKSKWLKIVTSTIEELLSEGKALLEAEIDAIRKANSAFSDKNTLSLSFSDMSHSPNIVCAEIKGADENEWQLVLPIGTTYDTYYGDIIMTRSYMDAMIENQKVLKNTKPFLNEDHDRGRALGWANDIRATDDGLEAKWKFTPPGKQLIQDEVYKYYSGEIMPTTDGDTGEVLYPVFRGAALTNSPVMKGMPEAHLSDNKGKSEAQGPKDEGEESMDFSKIKDESLALSDSEKKELVVALGFKSRDDEVVALTEKVEALSDVNSTLKEQVTAMGDKLKIVDEAKVETFLSEAIAGGKLKPVDKDKWKERLDKDFATFSEVLNEMPVSVDLGKTEGSGLDDDGDDKEKVLAEKTNAFLGRKGNKE